MKYRKLDVNNDYSFGHKNNDFWINVPDGVAQSVLTRLQLYQGEWWLDISVGTPWKTQVLGKYTNNTRDAVLVARIGETKGVKSIMSFNSNLDRNTREYRVNTTIDTVYGTTTISEPL